MARGSDVVRELAEIRDLIVDGFLLAGPNRLLRLRAQRCGIRQEQPRDEQAEREGVSGYFCDLRTARAMGHDS